jgi:hypothetical protein
MEAAAVGVGELGGDGVRVGGFLVLVGVGEGLHT